MNGIPSLHCILQRTRNMGSPKSREAQGDEISIVVRERESRSQSEGEQVVQMLQAGRYGRCETLKLNLASLR